MSTSLYSMFAADNNASENGKWFDFGPDIQLKIRRFKSKKSRKTREELEAPYKRATKFGSTLPDSVVEDITNKHVAQGIVVDWKGVTDLEGTAVAFSPAAVLKLVTDLPEFRDAIIEISLSLDSYREEIREDIAGNSPKSS